MTLYHGLPGVYFRSVIEWQSENFRVFVRFPMAFVIPNDEAWYEIPYGLLKRDAYDGQFGGHTLPNGDWPALDSVTCRNDAEDYTVTVCNRGLPCNRVKDGILMLGLVRSPQIPVFCENIAGAREVGPNVFEYAMFSSPGSLRDGRVLQRGHEFNAQFNAATAGPGGSLSATHSFLQNDADNVQLSAVKRAEDNDDLVIRGYELYGDTAADTLDGVDSTGLVQTNLLEREPKPAANIRYRPHEIKTLRLQ